MGEQLEDSGKVEETLGAAFERGVESLDALAEFVGSRLSVDQDRLVLDNWRRLKDDARYLLRTNALQRHSAWRC